MGELGELGELGEWFINLLLFFEFRCRVLEKFTQFTQFTQTKNQAKELKGQSPMDHFHHFPVLFLIHHFQFEYFPLDIQEFIP